MKSKIMISVAVIAAMLTTACEYNFKGADKKEKPKTIIDTSVVDVVTYEKLEDLNNHSDIIVVGEYIADGEPIMTSNNKGENYHTGKMIGKLKINRVLKGDVKVGDEISIIQRYTIEKKDGNTYIDDRSGLTPIKKGDAWVCFLAYDDREDVYWTVSSYLGRFHVPKNKDDLAQHLTAEEMGLYEKNDYNSMLYNQLVKAYDWETKPETDETDEITETVK